MQWKNLRMPEAHKMLHAVLAEDPSKVQLETFADAFGALYAGVELTTRPIMAFMSNLPAPKLAHWIVFLCGVALLIYGWRQGARNDAAGLPAATTCSSLQ